MARPPPSPADTLPQAHDLARAHTRIASDAANRMFCIQQAVKASEGKPWDTADVVGVAKLFLEIMTDVGEDQKPKA